MPVYKVIRYSLDEDNLMQSDEFDTSDEEKWESLKSMAEFHTPKEEFDRLPDDPPNDPNIWFELYGAVHPGEFPNEEDAGSTDHIKHRTHPRLYLLFNGEIINTTIGYVVE
jgi:hypothetical protein